MTYTPRSYLDFEIVQEIATFLSQFTNQEDDKREDTKTLQHPLYKRCFGDRELEVHCSRVVLTTAYPLFGSFFFFQISLLGDHLLVKEIDEETKEVLELIDFDKKPWRYRLKEMHNRKLHAFL